MPIFSYFRKSAPSAPFTGDDAARMKLYKKLRFQSFIAGTVGYSLYYVCRTSLNVVKKPILDPEAEITLKNHHDPLYVPKDSPLVKGLLEAYKKVTGDSEAEAISIGGATYARVLPCGVAFGPIFPGEESYIHMRDERISLASFKKMIKIYKEAFAILCFE